MATGVDDAPWVLNLPDPVRRELQRAIIRWISGDPDQARLHCNELWAAGYRELQLLGTALLGTQSEDWVPDWAEKRAPDSMDRLALTALAAEGLTGWRMENTRAYLNRIEAWLQDKRARMQYFGLTALQEVLELEGDWFPEFFEILDGYHWEPRGEARKVFVTLLQKAAQKSSGEMAGFLLSVIEKNPEKPAPYLAALGRYFPDRQNRLFRQALSR